MSIFPMSHKDVDRFLISSFLSNNSVVTLSGLNRSTYETLSNSFFKEHFNAQHPHLSKYNIFQTLQTFHPKNCWKIACCCFSRFPAISSSSFGAVYMNAPPVFCSLLNLEKERLELEKKEICGSGDEDPNSPVQQAWDALMQGKESLAVVQYQKNWVFEQLQECDPTHNLPLVYLFVSIIEKQHSMSAEVEKLKNVYGKIEEAEFVCNCSLNRINLMLDSLFVFKGQKDLSMQEGSQFYNYSKSLAYEHSMAVKAEKALPCHPILSECLRLIEGINKKEIEPTATTLNRIKELIDLYATHQVGANLWKRLYFQCAQNNPEENWSQKHFHEFLPQLLQIVKDADQSNNLIMFEINLFKKL